MQKKARLTLKLKPGETPRVKQGAHVKRGDLLTEVIAPTIYEFDLSRLFKLKPQAALKTLVVKPGQPVEKGMVVAKRQGLLKSQLLRSAQAGQLVLLDAARALLGIQIANEIAPVVAWFDGVVAQTTTEALIFEIAGQVLTGTAGRGGPISGKLTVVPKSISSLEMPTDLEERILAITEAASDVVAKADALGAGAIIAEKVEQPPFSLPYLLVEDIAKLMRYNEQTVIICGDEKEMLVINSTDPLKSKK